MKAGRHVVRSAGRRLLTITTAAAVIVSVTAAATPAATSPSIAVSDAGTATQPAAASADRFAGTRSVITMEPGNKDWGARLATAVWLSPNGDHVKDKAAIEFALAKRSVVSVRVHRGEGRGAVVYKERLGPLARGEQSWKWAGKNASGAVVRDGAYTAVLVADPVAPGAKNGRVRPGLYVDTRFDAPWTPQMTGDTVYPRTTVVRDMIGITLDNFPDSPMTLLGHVVMAVQDAQGRTVWARGFEYHDTPYTASMPLAFAGRHVKGDVALPAGDYTLRYKVWDKAGNPGGSKTVAVRVSDKPLVEASGSVVVPPTGSSKASEVGTGSPSAVPLSRGVRSRKAGGDPPQIPCGTVVPSEVYSDQGAMSFRSSDACGGTWTRPSIATAIGGVGLDVLSPQVAPRGIQTSRVTMRGKPTVSGETDTARLSSPRGWTHVSSSPVAGETLTTTAPHSHVFEAQYSSQYVRSVDWSITTHGTDSYDVAAVTVHYTYLTPQS